MAKASPGRGRPADQSSGDAATAPKTDASTSQPQKLAAGSYVLRMDQPYSRMVDMMLDTQYYSTADPRPYDDTGWTFGPLRNVATLRVVDPSILAAPMTKIDGEVRGRRRRRQRLRLVRLERDCRTCPGVAPLSLEGRQDLCGRGAFRGRGHQIQCRLVPHPRAGKPRRPALQLSSAAQSLGLRAHAVGSEITVKRHLVSVPRIALLHTWVNTQNDGWFRLALDECEIPYAYISDHDVRATPDLKAKYDVIIFPPVTSSLPTLINGVRKSRLLDDGSDFGGPVPFKSSDLTPNLGGVDDSDDIRGGLGFDGLAHLKKFVENGGVFVPVTASAGLPVGLGMIEYVTIAETPASGQRVSPPRGGAGQRKPGRLRIRRHRRVYFDQAPVFRVSLAGGGFGRGGAGAAGGANPARSSGRGSATDPDVPQGRPLRDMEPEPTLKPAERELHIDPEIREYLAGTILPQRMWPRGGSLVGRKRPLGERHACRRFRARRNTRGHRRAARQGTRRPLRQQPDVAA